MPPDAAIPDAYQHDAAFAPSCAPGEMVCNNTCADVMTSELYCGNCETSCAPTFGCASGTCRPANISCARVREIDAAAPDGFFRNPNTGVGFYCDFTNNFTYDGVGMGANTGNYPGWVMISAADLNDPGRRSAFIDFYNRQGGLLNLQTGWTSGNCCLKAADSGAQQYLALAGNHLYPAPPTGTAAQCGGPYNETRYRFFEAEAGPVAPLPMAENYLDARPASQSAKCTDSFPMPAMFWRRRAGLD